MALITGTTGTDTLIGTAGSDVLQSYSTDSVDTLQGLGGADVYDLRRSGTSMTYNFLIDDAGNDGAANTIIGVGALYQSASFGYQGYATAVRIGDDLIIHTPGRPHRFRKPARPDYDIEIKDQYDGGHISSIEAGGITYNLSLDGTGTAQADMMAGTNQGDILNAGAGNDWVFGNGGRDTLNVGAGDDIVFGGTGGDTITADDGNNLIFAEQGNDHITTGAGHDRVEGGDGRDTIRAGAGDDTIDGGSGNNRLRGQDGNDTLKGGTGNELLVGGKGNDTLIGGAGDNTLIGGKGGDLYQFSTADAGNNVIIDKGDAPLAGTFATAKNDVVELRGFNSIYDAMQGTTFAVSGDDLILTYENPGSAPGTIGQITIQGQFAGPKYAIEKIAFGPSNLANDFNIVALDGDLNTFSVHDGPDVGGNDIVRGTAGDDELYGGIGHNIYLGSAGADTYIFKDQEDNRGGVDLIFDFDLSQDVIDLSEIKTLDRAGLTITNNAAGNAEISSIYETIELVGIDAALVSDNIFVFA